MANEVMVGLTRELDSVMAELGTFEAACGAGGVRPEVERLCFDVQRLTRRFRLLGTQPAAVGREGADFGILLCRAIRPAGRECKRRQCFLRLDLGRVRGFSAVATQTVDAVLAIVEDAVDRGATWIEVAAQSVGTGLDLTVRTDADLTSESLGFVLVRRLAASLDSVLQFRSLVLDGGGVCVTLHARAVWVGSGQQPMLDVSAATGT